MENVFPGRYGTYDPEADELSVPVCNHVYNWRVGRVYILLGSNLSLGFEERKVYDAGNGGYPRSSIRNGNPVLTRSRRRLVFS